MTPSRISMAHVHTFRNLGDAQIRPDGREVAVVVSDVYVDGTPLPRSEILVVDLENGSSRPLSAGGLSELAPRWAPDGQTLAFLSDVDEPGVLRPYVTPVLGTPRPILSGAASSSGVVERPRLHTVRTDAPEWSPNSREVGVLMFDEGASNPAVRAVTHETRHPLSRAWAINAETGDERALSPEGLHVWEFAWSPSGDAIAAITSSGAKEKDWYEPTLTVIDAAGARSRVISAPPDDLATGQPPRNATIGRQMALPRWSPDGKWLSFICGSMSDRGLIGGDLYVVGLDGSPPRNLTPGAPASVSWYEWDADSSSVLVCAWHEGRQALGRCDVSSEGMDVIWSGEVAFADRYQPRFSRAADGHLALVREDHIHPRELWTFNPLATPDGQWRQVTTIQPSVEGLVFSELRTLTWTASDGTVSHGHLLRPRDADPDAALPMVVFPHGGPTFLHQYLFHSRVEGPYAVPFELFPANGVSILLANMRGSLGWGRPFAEANLGDLGGGDLADTIAGVDYCIEAGLADPKRIGYAGWSSSGLLAAAVSCMTTRFRAILVGAAVVDKRAMRHVNPSFDKLFYPPDAYEAGGQYDRSSPITHVAKVKTPTLIIHAFGDQILPAGQALEWHVAMQENGQTPEMVLYEGEGHAIMGKASQADIAERVVGWFVRALT
jgi:dipeptidyl aminopeptidase/acylaminoacyl peptidase